MDIDDIENFITTRRTLMDELEHSNEENIRLIHELDCLKKENAELINKSSFENQDVKGLVNNKILSIEAENNKLFDSVNHMATLKFKEDQICRETIFPLMNLDLSYLFKEGNGDLRDFATNGNRRKTAIPFSLVNMVDIMHSSCFEKWRFLPEKCYLSELSIILTDNDASWMTNDKRCIICENSFSISYGKTLRAAHKPYISDEITYGILCCDCFDSHPLIRACLLYTSPSPRDS